VYKITLRMSKRPLLAGFVLALLVCALVAGAGRLRLLEAVEWQGYDLLVRSHPLPGTLDSLVFVDFDEGAGELRWCNAGHFEPLLVHGDGTTTSLPGGGLPLGMFEGSAYAMDSRRVATNDLLVLFTDGLAELQNDRDEFFGTDGILGAIVPRRDQPLREIAASVLETAARFHRAAHPDDDLTLFLMRFR